MKVAVCIKQVPVISKITFDYASRTIIRAGVPLEVNSFDLLAVDRAVAMKGQTDTDVVVYTMGPGQARDALIQCLAMGADRAVLLSDLPMAGADTLATARTLALALESGQFDLVLCGRNSTDSETGQVGPELAQLLGLPHISNVRNLDYQPDSQTIIAERVTDDGYEVIRCTLPALVCVTEGIMPERFPGREEMRNASEKPIQEVRCDQLSQNLSDFGATGSPTWVSDIQIVQSTRRAIVIEGASPNVATQQVVEGLKHIAPVTHRTVPRQWVRYPQKHGSDIWVVVEGDRPELRKASFELLGKGRELAEHTQAQVAALLVGANRPDHCLSLAAYGADRVLVIDPCSIGHPISIPFTSTLSDVVNQQQPYAVLFHSNANGRDMASRLAANLGLGLTGDCVDLEINDQMELVQMKPALGGNVVAPILSKTKPYLTTLRPGLLDTVEPNWNALAPIDTLDATPTRGTHLEILESHAEDDARGAELEAANVVIGIGKGAGGPENVEAIDSLAKSIGASIACTRDVAEAGWLSRQVQVGLTGRAIAPQIYIAVGIRGDFNHMVGVQKAGTIIAINISNNPRRDPIQQGADFTIIGDWQEYLPPLIEALKPVLEKSY